MAGAAVLLGRTIKGFEIRVVGAAPRAARFGGFNSSQLVLLTFAISGALAGLAGIIEVAGPVGHLQPGISPGYGFTAIIVAFLGRLNPVGILIAGLFLALTFIGGEQAQIAMKIPQDMTKVFQGILLFYVLACDSLILYRIKLVMPLRQGHRWGCLRPSSWRCWRPRRRCCWPRSGELVVERAGVLNLGVEGMMIVGAACGFGGAWLTGSTFIGALFGIFAGMALALVFGADDARACGQPGRNRPRADDFGRRDIGPDRRGLRRRAHRHGAAAVHSRPHHLPFVGQILFGQDAFVYFSLALIAGISWFLYRTRAGLILRAIGDNHVSAHALGYPVLRIRMLRGAVRRRLRGPCRRLSCRWPTRRSSCRE